MAVTGYETDSLGNAQVLKNRARGTRRSLAAGLLVLTQRMSCYALRMEKIVSLGLKTPAKLELCVKVAQPNWCCSLDPDACIYKSSLALRLCSWLNDDSYIGAHPANRKSGDPTCNNRLFDNVVYDENENAG